ncbi:CPBP family intramembrane glutamic endopeptidase [Microbacterium sp. KR10-403]|uniref:CPBP family intramembrane glutamic endopeptidase n=1 Tax=Microbacterium sp. KR10-403 TaxID=3158581 RepID=UPI0032E45432
MVDQTHDTHGPASWPLRHRWPVAIAFALVPVVFTAAASATAELTGADDIGAALVIAAGAAVSALIGLGVMKVSPATLRRYGFRAAHRAAAAWWFAPLPITVLIVLLTQGVHLPVPTVAAYAVLTIAVAVNEEVWFRGIVLAVLRSAGVRGAVIGTSALFGVLHLANLAGGENPADAALQLVFAVLFGLVAALLVVLTGSLWPGILWHAAWDFTNYLGGNATTPAALIGIGLACALMLVYAIVLWPRAMRAGAAASPLDADGAPVR